MADSSMDEDDTSLKQPTDAAASAADNLTPAVKLSLNERTQLFLNKVAAVKAAAETPAGAGNSGSGGNGSPPQTTKLGGDGAYSAILTERQSRFTIKHLHGDGEADCNPAIGTFYNPPDYRITKTVIKSFFGNKQNVSFSFDPSSLTCNNCKTKPGHAIAGSDADPPPTFVLSDQCFPAALPAAGAGGCIHIIRIENGTVNELAKLFVDVFAGVHVQVGSLILLSSVSHLAAVGTAAYAESIVRAAKSILTSFGGKATVRTGVPVLLGGIKDKSLVRSLLDVAAWADSLPSREQLPLEARKKLTSILRAGSACEPPVERIILQLPVSLTTFEKKTVVSGGFSVPEVVPPFDTKAEEEIIYSLITELNSKQGAHLAEVIDFSRGGTRLSVATSQKTVIIVGSSHANYLATSLSALGYRAVTVELRNWRPNTMTVGEALADLQAKIAAADNLVAIVYWCFDNATYYSSIEDSILPAVRDVSGHYHIHGSLMIAPSEMFSKSVKVCIPLFSVSSQAKKIALSPLPRYWHHRCCGDTDHVANLEEDGYESELFTGLDSVRRIIKDVLFTSGIKDVKTHNTSQLCVTTEGSRTTGNDIRDALAVMWGEDPVHPSRDCYNSLGEHLDALLCKTEASATSSTTSERPLKRPRWLEADSANTVVPRTDPSGRGGRGSFIGGRGPRGGRGGRGRRGRRGY
jgi:hypothetical protein